MYIGSAMILGVYFAMYSGTVESVVYDTVLDAAGTAERYQTRLGGVRFLESAALVVSSLLGGWLAGLAGPRVTYFVTIPFTLLAIVAFARFDEPGCTAPANERGFGAHITLTYRTITGRGALLPIVLLGAVTALITQTLFEFGPLWLVALAAPAVLFGPYRAALVSTLGVGGLIAGRLRLDHPAVVVVVAVAMVTSSAVLSMTGTSRRWSSPRCSCCSFWRWWGSMSARCCTTRCRPPSAPEWHRGQHDLLAGIPAVRPGDRLDGGIGRTARRGG